MNEIRLGSALQHMVFPCIVGELGAVAHHLVIFNNKFEINLSEIICALTGPV
jgi:hypothetical protein